jgi:hypothetical protein
MRNVRILKGTCYRYSDLVASVPTDRVPETVKGRTGGDIFRADSMKEFQSHRREATEKKDSPKPFFFNARLTFSIMKLGGPVPSVSGQCSRIL